MPARQHPPIRLWEFLDHGFLHELGIPALVASVVLFVCAMTLLSANISEMRTGYARVQQTNESLLQLANISSDILRIEMTVRGYALSGDSAYLKWLKESRGHLLAEVDALDQLSANDPDMRKDVAALRVLARDHSSYFEALAQRILTDRAEVIVEIVDYSKKVKRRPIEHLVLDMRGDMMRILSTEQREAEARVVGAYRYAIAISSIALLLGAVGFAIVIHDRRKD